MYKVPWSLIKGTITEDVMKKDNGFVSVDASVLNMKSKFHPTRKELDMYHWLRKNVLEETSDSND